MIVPIILPMSSGSGRYEPDHECPKCGHKWDDKSEPMSNLSKLILLLFIAVCLYFLIGLFGCIMGGGRMYNAVFVRTVENYEIPDGWEILKNSKDQYIIKHGKKYISRNYISLDLASYPNIDPPLKCSSEIRAKSTLKKYLDRKSINEFRTINKTNN